MPPQSILVNAALDDTNYSSDKIFNNLERADDRKTWLEAYDKTSYLDTSRSSVQYE